MFEDPIYERRQPRIEGDEPESADKKALLAGEPVAEPDAPEKVKTERRHAVLMDCLEEESERQKEERLQAQIDDDYYHHLQWTQEDAKVLTDRGQAPLVFNIARGTIDWLCGTERRLRKDYRIRPREKNDTQGAETKTQLFKYVDDVNLGPWHRSRAFKDAVVSGLGWLEEGIETDPDKELVFAGSEDWRRVLRDSRGREFDLDDNRYQFRRKLLDLDYAMALLPGSADHLRAAAGRWGNEDEEVDDVWYLGERLTNAHTQQWQQAASILGGDWSVRGSGSVYDRGRRSVVELLECWYRVPETVQVFGAGPLRKSIVNKADPAHMQLLNDRHMTYQTVKMRMRVMVGTKYSPCWDGVSPFRHGRFLLVPIWGYRRGRDGMVYGAMRGMRDPQDDFNKRRSKAQHALASNRLVIGKSALDAGEMDLEEMRQEAARHDGVLVVDKPDNVRFEKFMGEMQANMEMAQQDITLIRDAGGVTGDNLGQETSAVSGKAILAKQEQGSMTTFELFDNLLLAFKLCGQMRLSHIEQFCTHEWRVRIDPKNKPSEWIEVNMPGPDGRIVNDITATQADFVVDQQDYRATLTMAAMESMFDLLGKLAVFAPQVVLQLLDLAVDGADDIPNKDEWVNRIRRLTGQRDPSKEPTPEEIAADQERAAKDAKMEQISMETAQAQLDTLRAKITDTNAGKVLKNLQALLAAIDGAAQVATVPGIAAPADELARSAGFVDQNAGALVADPGLPALPAPQENPAPGAEFPAPM
jgi:hypothetical protein